MGAVKFVRDVESPELGTYVDSIRIAPLDAKDPHGPGELLRCERAREWGLRRMVESGSISGYPGIRALRLWYAGIEGTSWDDDDRDISSDKVRDMSLDEVVESNKSRQPAILLASSRWTGGLAVSSCLGQEYPTTDVRIPTPNRLETTDPVVQVTMQDFGRLRWGLVELVELHWDREEIERFSVDVAPADPRQLDARLVHLLSVLPEHSLAKSLAAPSAVLLAA